MAALSLRVHSLMTSALFCFMKSINAFKGFLMCGFFSLTGCAIIPPEFGWTVALGAIDCPNVVNYDNLYARVNAKAMSRYMARLPVGMAFVWSHIDLGWP